MLKKYVLMVSVFLSFLFFSSLAQAQVQRTWRVPADFPTIQDAINDTNQVHDGDQIIVSQGTYYENINFNGRALKIKSEDVTDPGSTIIDGTQSGSVVTFSNGEGSGSILNGFTIKNGSATYGGGIYCSGSSPTIKNNIIKDNISPNGGGIFCGSNANATITNNTISGHDYGGASYGGGILCSNSSPLIDGNTIIDNVADYGGGIGSDEGACPRIINNFIGTDSEGASAGNSAQYGGGIWCEEAKPTIGESDNGNTIKNNSAYSGGWGGGIYLEDCGTSEYSLVINDNTIEDNQADHCGGGISVMYGYTQIIFNEIIDNHSTGVDASEGGGGIYLNDCYEVRIKWNQIKENQEASSGCGGGIYCYVDEWSTGTIEVNSNYFYDNWVNDAGGGIFYETEDFVSPALIYNNLFVENKALSTTARGGAGIFIESGNPQVWNNTLDKNSIPNVNYSSKGGGIRCFTSSPDIRNTIVYGNWSISASTIDEIAAPAGTTVEYCCVRGGYTGTGNFPDQPVYTGWYQLAPLPNPCIDSGDPNQYMCAPTDWENESRPNDGGSGNNYPDVGWDEWYE